MFSSRFKNLAYVLILDGACDKRDTVRRQSLYSVLMLESFFILFIPLLWVKEKKFLKHHLLAMLFLKKSVLQTLASVPENYK